MASSGRPSTYARITANSGDSGIGGGVSDGSAAESALTLVTSPTWVGTFGSMAGLGRRLVDWSPAAGIIVGSSGGFGFVAGLARTTSPGRLGRLANSPEPAGLKGSALSGVTVPE